MDKLCKEAHVKREKDELIQGENVYRYRDNPYLAHLERELFRIPYHVFDEKDSNTIKNSIMIQDSISIFEASNPKEELRQVCLKIRELVRQGKYCYRDIAVITGGFRALRISGKGGICAVFYSLFLGSNQ